MLTHELIQGTQSWHDYRAQHFNASDAPAVMGHSSYKTRNQLLKERATGIVPEVDAAVQRRFDDGHRFEALARPLAEAIIGDDLFPVTGSLGKYSASFDGLTMDEAVAFEHKTLNDALRDMMHADVRGHELALEYQIQMEQQCLVSGCEKVLFMASKWNGDQLVEERHCWYTPNAFLRKQIVDAWTQFEADLAAYQHVEVLPPVVGKQVERLPALSVRLVGEVTSSNLAVYRQTAIAVIASINTTLVTDVDFADAEQVVKFCANGESELEQVKKQALAQTATIDELFQTIDELKEHLRTKRLELEKLVKVRKESIRIEIVNAAKGKYASHIADLNQRNGTSYLGVQYPDFAAAIKGKKNISSLHEACDTLLARSKIEANHVADRILANISLPAVKEFNFLFSDLAVLCLKEVDDFKAAVAYRVNEHQAKEAARIAAETARIAEQERVKAEAKAAAELAAAREADRVAEQARIAAEGLAAARAVAAAALAEIKVASPVFLTQPLVEQPVVYADWTQPDQHGVIEPIVTSVRPRASTRALVDNILSGLLESEMQDVLSYLQTTFVKQAA